MEITFDPYRRIHNVAVLNKRFEVTITNSSEKVSQWINLIRTYYHHKRPMIVGLDLKWLPDNFDGTSSGSYNPAALLNLCVGKRCLMFQLIHCDNIPDILKSFLSEDENIEFVGVKIEKQKQKLKKEYGVKVKNAVDLRELAAAIKGRPEMNEWGLNFLAKEIAGLDLEKSPSVKYSDWGIRALLNNQIEYAVVRAFASFDVGRLLHEA